MGSWAIASLFTVAIVLWMEVEANPQLFQNYEQPGSRNQFQQILHQQQAGIFYLPKVKPGEVAETHSALNLQPEIRLGPVQDLPVKQLENPGDKYYHLYKKFDEKLFKSLEEDQSKNYPKQDLTERKGISYQPTARGYDDHGTSQTTHILGPHQIETIQSDHFHKQVPAYEVSEFQGLQQHQAGQQHGEVHYHQHKHIHKHEHKQEHVHQHKQEHQHKHLHSQKHKHDHHSEHKHGHGHEHKHDHHQQHKHDHHHDHKHDNHHDHKHNHGHKHEHHEQGKHHHQHGHKHNHHKTQKHYHSKHY